MANRTVVLYPSPGMGHLVSFVELANLFSAHDLDATIVITDPPLKTDTTLKFLATTIEANPNITFHRLPTVALDVDRSSPHREALDLELLRLSNQNLRHYLTTTSPCALVIDMFCYHALDVSAKLGIPCYFFSTCGASALAVFLHFPSIHSSTDKSFKDLGALPIEFPGMPSVPADHMPLPMLDRDDEAYKRFIECFTRFPEAQGIIVNTFEALEWRAVEAIARGLCYTKGTAAVPVFAVGPLVSSKGRHKDNKEVCLSWLDQQPKGSVVFLCFGSVGVLTAEQIMEIAVGLEDSGHRFLWVVRTPPNQNGLIGFGPPDEPDLDVLLPNGFLDRTRSKGLVVKSWAPQVDVLDHESVGGFVTHCGWNSILEGIGAGVPMLAWPLYAEQRLNKVFLEELGLVESMVGYNVGMVKAKEVEMKIKMLMESERGEELRAKTQMMKDRAKEAMSLEGSSYASLVKLVDIFKSEKNY